MAPHTSPRPFAECQLAVWRSAQQGALFKTFLTSALEILPDAVAVARAKHVQLRRAKMPFAAARMYGRRELRVGLAIPTEICPRLDPPHDSERWPRRLSAVTVLGALDQVDGVLKELLQLAWERS